MPTTKNKIKFGLKSVYYAKATIAENGTATYATPVAIPGAVNLSMDPQGESTPFYADNMVYWEGDSNNGYEGNLEIALVPDSFREDILNEYKDANGVYSEDPDVETEHFALLFQFEGDKKATRHVLYNCKAGRPTLASGTKADSVEPQTETMSLSARPIYVDGRSKYFIKSKKDISSNTYKTLCSFKK